MRRDTDKLSNVTLVRFCSATRVRAEYGLYNNKKKSLAKAVHSRIDKENCIEP